MLKYKDERGFVIEPLASKGFKSPRNILSVINVKSSAAEPLSTSEDWQRNQVVTVPTIGPHTSDFIDVKIKQPLTERRSTLR